MSLQKMIATHPQVQDETEELVLAARHAMLCSLFCTSCADACVAEDMAMAQCIRNCLDCADVCAATARLAVRRTAANIDVLRAQMEACIKACETCAEECAKHDNPHCALCAEMCRECAEDCRKALPLVK
ncbi:four-helix bundle copper-binding protein [Qipengyuania psychrotolerans]|uniref:Four-helix bundle copper-binding protein n=1 Tax=Qipengyuania psychrotolerans TaxID=2867238 RepID=A0ABX8ZC90_9SPHN|nr:four-helix bundle copper-binding protein [Qipengyuania psychrotolerans]QZD86356.1 four-helix bundle copper-binding protein [Qipengyuania psychrotolerans]